MRYDIVDWLTWVALGTAIIGAVVTARDANFAASFAWCMVGAVGLLTTLRSAQVDMLLQRQRDLEIQATHYQNEVVSRDNVTQLRPGVPEFLRRDRPSRAREDF